MTCMNDVDFKFKIIITGKNNVGKTSLIRRYMDNMFSESYIPTLLSDFSTKDIKYKNKIIRLVLYELAGHEKYVNSQNRHFSGADYVCSVASFDDRSSIDAISTSLKNVRAAWKEANERGNVPMTCIVNKSDLLQGQDDLETARLIYRYKVLVRGLTRDVASNGFVFTSAKTGDGVSVLFTKIAVELLGKLTH